VVYLCPCAQDNTTFLDDGAIGADELGKLAAVLERMAEHGPTVIPNRGITRSMQSTGSTSFAWISCA
jgi:hypothetical protein